MCMDENNVYVGYNVPVMATGDKTLPINRN